MRISRWGSVFVVLGIVISGIAIGAPLAIEANLKSLISEMKSALPQGNSFDYEGLEYKPLNDEVFFKKVRLGWINSQNDERLSYADGELTLHNLTLRENSGGIEHWVSFESEKDKPINYSLTWDKADLNITNPDFKLIGSKGKATGVKIPNISSLKDLSIAEIITKHISIADVLIDDTKLSYEKTINDVGPLIVNGGTSTIKVSNYSAGILSDLQIDKFNIATVTTDRFGEKLDLKLESKVNKFSDLNILPIFRKLVINDYDYANLWQSDLETFEDFKSTLVELDATKSDLSEFGAIKSNQVEMKVAFKDVHVKIKVEEAIAFESKEFVSNGISLKNIEAITDFDQKPDEKVVVTLDEVYSKKIDVSKMSNHFEELIRGGSLGMEQRIQNEGFLSMMPSMYFEEVGFKKALIDIKGKKNDKVDISQFKVFDISIDDDKNLSFGINVDGIATKKNTVRMIAPELYALLGVIKGDHVLLSANLDVDQLTKKNQISLNDFSLNIEELGGVSFEANLGNMNVSNIETFDPMNGQINSLAFHVKDRGVVDAGKLIVAMAQQWPVEQADDLFVGIVSSQRKEGQSARTDNFFDSLEAILTSAGDFHIKGDPNNPVEFINVMGLLGASDIDGLVNKLELESEFNPLSTN